jgi:RNA polymerase sigma-70 factor, ECF subfamily
MGGIVATRGPEVVVEEARLARTAAAGDGSSFAVLYERYEQRAFNLAYRIAGSEADAADAVQEAFLNATQKLPRLADGELWFGHCLFAATRHSCHDLMPRRERPLPGEPIPATPEPPEEAIAGASMRLPVRQREALALRELGQLSYEEIAAIMETGGNSVAQLISRARINLSDELRGTVLASIAAPSPECERALPLIAMRQDGQLEAGSREAAWLDVHLTACDRCQRGVEAMQGADASYRSWAPIAAAPGLLAATMAKAALLTGSDWSGEIGEAEAAHSSAGPASAATSAPAADRDRSPRGRRPLLAAGLAALLFLAGFSAILLRDDPAAPPLEQAAEATPAPGAAAPHSGNGAKTKTKSDPAQRSENKAKAGTSAAQASAGDAASTPEPVVAQVRTEGSSGEPASRPARPVREAGVEQTQRTSMPRPGRRPQPTTAAPEPAPAPAPVTEAPSPVEEPAAEPPRRREPPGKPADRPPR